MPAREIKLPPLHQSQYEIASSPARFKVVSAGRRFGKALALDTPIPTLNGWKTMAEIDVGDWVFDEWGCPTQVTAVTETMYERTCYRIEFSDGNSIVADADHQWMTYTHRARKWLLRRGKAPRHFDDGLCGIRTTQDILDTLTHSKRRDNNHSIPTCMPVQYPDRLLPIPPYVLGVWLGDGNADSANIASADEEIIQNVRDLGYPVYKRKSDYMWGVSDRQHVRSAATGRYEPRPETLCTQLKTAGLINNKHIPSDYLIASVHQRLELLKGLMDTDGTVSPSGHCEFMNTNRNLAEGVYELLVSLGMKARLKTKRVTLYGKDYGEAYRVTFTPSMPVFKLTRKLKRLRLDDHRSTITTRYVTDVVAVPSVPVRCIEVNSPSHLYLAGRGYIPTHNSQLGSATCVRVASAGGQAWWVAPNYLTGEAGWDVIRDLCHQLKEVIPEIRIYDSQPYTVRFPSGGMVQIRSAEDPQKLRGKGLNYVVLDEAAFMQEEVWEDAIRPALMDKGGSALFISTPFGKNWFYNLYQLALRQQNELRDGKIEKADWQNFHYTTYNNPFIPAAEIDGLRETMSKLRFDREILAEFVDGEGEVFRGIDTAARAPVGMQYRSDHTYVLGVDLGRTHDYTVISVIDATTKQEVDLDRFNQLSWEFQRSRITLMADKWHASVMWVERNSFGDPNIEALQQQGLPVMPFYTTWQSKEPLILGLALGIERGDLEILPNTHTIAAQANRELGDYTVSSLPRGGYKYGAPIGGFDDCVIARALAWHGVSRTGVFRFVVLE